MGLWQKTLFYLGLVDEDAAQYEGPYSDQQPEDVGVGAQQRAYSAPGRGQRQSVPSQRQGRGQTMRYGREDEGQAVSPAFVWNCSMTCVFSVVPRLICALSSMVDEVMGINPDRVG